MELENQRELYCVFEEQYISEGNGLYAKNITFILSIVDYVSDTKKLRLILNCNANITKTHLTNLMEEIKNRYQNTDDFLFLVDVLKNHADKNDVDGFILFVSNPSYFDGNLTRFPKSFPNMFIVDMIA